MNSPKYANQGAYPILANKVSRKTEIPIELVVMWILGTLILQTPFGTSYQVKLGILVLLIGISIFYVIVKPLRGFTFWSIGLGILIAQTGFQLNVKNIKTSALEFVILALSLFLLIYYQQHSLSLKTKLYVPGQKFFFGFVFFALVLFLFGMVRGDNFLNALYPLKGFILYPFMVYVFLIGIQNEKTMRWAVFLPAGLFLLAAFNGLSGYQEANLESEYLVRVGGNYAAINLYGITLASVSLLLAGIGSSHPKSNLRITSIIFAFILFWGAIVSVSRAVAIGYVLGLLTILFLGKGRTRLFPFILILLVSLYFLLPQEITARLFQLSDASTMKRESYLISGFEAFKVFWFTGAGWGNGYSYYSGAGLVKTGFYPWYHNDYLNLAVQVGVFGLGLYLTFWSKILVFAFRQVTRSSNTQYTGYIRGSFAGLISALVAAAFDHVLWRPDMAGFVIWLVGILLVAINLDKKQAA